MVEINKAPLVSTSKGGIKYVVNRMPLTILAVADGQTIPLNGIGKGPKGLVIPGAPYGVTTVEASFWDKYVASRPNSTLLRNRELYAVDTPLEIDTFVQTKGTRATGFEPVDAENPSRGLGGPKDAKVEKASADTK